MEQERKLPGELCFGVNMIHFGPALLDRACELSSFGATQHPHICMAIWNACSCASLEYVQTEPTLPDTSQP